MSRDYKKIKAWRLADRLALEVYKATKNFPKSETWALTSQMRRAAISVPANIVEGATRKNKKEYLQFLYIAISSLMELGYYIKFAKEVKYLTTGNFKSLTLQYEESVKTLRGLINYIEKSKV